MQLIIEGTEAWDGVPSGLTDTHMSPALQMAQCLSKTGASFCPAAIASHVRV